MILSLYRLISQGLGRANARPKLKRYRALSITWRRVENFE